MESVRRFEDCDAWAAKCRDHAAIFSNPGPVLQVVETGELLFAPGETRQLYRVERGAICHYMLWADGRHEVVEFAFPGDIIGLGYMDTHVSTAQAMVETVVSLVSDSAYAEALANDDRLSFRIASAAEREFEFLRDQSIEKGRDSIPTARLANLLLALSNMNRNEGRDTEVIADDVTAGFVAERLDVSIDKLGAALLNLKKVGAVENAPGGLRILDAAALQRLADAA